MGTCMLCCCLFCVFIRIINILPSTTMANHPTGIMVEIIGTECNTQGRSCEEHNFCGSLLAEDVVVRFRKVQVIINQKEESAIAVYIVSDGIDGCHVGFLQCHLVKHWKLYDGLLAQVTEIYSNSSTSPTSRRKFYCNRGCCIATIILSLPDDTVNKLSCQKKKCWW